MRLMPTLVLQADLSDESVVEWYYQHVMPEETEGAERTVEDPVCAKAVRSSASAGKREDARDDEADAMANAPGNRPRQGMETGIRREHM